MEENKYGVLKYSAINIGDDIQSIAAMRYLPRIDEYIHRDRVDVFKSDKKVKTIMNAAWMLEPKHMPPSEDIDPLLISMHLKMVTRKAMTPKLKQYFINHAPVGCRDTDTMEYLNSLGIPAYFSGCITLTIRKNPEIKRQNYILTVDMPKYIQDEIKKRTKRPVYNVSRLMNVYFNQYERFKVAKMALYMYHSAHCIVTRAIHAGLPSLAFDTPVLMLDLKTKPFDNRRDPRYYGLIEFFNPVKEIDFLNNKDIYDFENPPENPKRHIETRDNLIKKCSDFTGYDNPVSLVENFENPFIELYSMLAYKHYRMNRNAYWLKPSELIKVAFRKAILKKTRCDLEI